jgi:hypothetical protein
LGAEGEEALANKGLLKTRRHDNYTHGKRGYTYLGPCTFQRPWKRDVRSCCCCCCCGGSGGSGTGGLERLCAPWAWELASLAPPTVLSRFWGSETSDPSARRNRCRLSSTDPPVPPGVEELLAGPLPLSMELGATAGPALGAPLVG